MRAVTGGRLLGGDFSKEHCSGQSTSKQVLYQTLDDYLVLPVTGHRCDGGIGVVLFFFFFLYIYLFIFSCIGSSLLRVSSL